MNLKLSLVVLLVLALSLQAEGAKKKKKKKATCASGWEKNGKKCFKLASSCGTAPTAGSCTFSDARNACKDEATNKIKNPKLTTPKIPKDIDFILNNANLMPDVIDNNNKVWLGATREANTGVNTWSYIGSDKADFQDSDLNGYWGNNQPDDENTNGPDNCQCGLMMARYVSWNSGPGLDDRDRDAPARALCEYSL